MAARAKGASRVVATIPTLQKYHTEDSFKLAVAPSTWEDEMTRLRSSSMGQIAHSVWDMQFQTIKTNMLWCLIAWGFFESGLTIMKAKVKVLVRCRVHYCETWATFNSGQICVTNPHPVACVEGPQMESINRTRCPTGGQMA